jgi:hypothetical protein
VLKTPLEFSAAAALPGPIALVLVNSLGNIARQRPHLISEVLPTLLRTASATAAAGTSSQAASMAHALKTSFVQLLRGGFVPDAAWHERMVAALNQLGLQDAADAAVRQQERSAKRERAAVERYGVENGSDVMWGGHV